MHKVCQSKIHEIMTD